MSADTPQGPAARQNRRAYNDQLSRQAIKALRAAEQVVERHNREHPDDQRTVKSSLFDCYRHHDEMADYDRAAIYRVALNLTSLDQDERRSLAEWDQEIAAFQQEHGGRDFGLSL